MKKFPKKLFVKIEEDSGTEYFVADADPATLVQTHEKIKVAVYSLSELGQIEGVVAQTRFKKV